MSSEDDGWNRLLSKKEDIPELSEQLKLFKEREERLREQVVAAVIIIAGLVLMVLGVFRIDDYFDGYGQFQPEDLPDLKTSFLLTLAGLIMILFASLRLYPRSRK